MEIRNGTLIEVCKIDNGLLILINGKFFAAEGYYSAAEIIRRELESELGEVYRDAN